MATPDLPSRINEEILSCKICFHEYTNQNPPKMLTCTHTFCQKCITDFISNNKAKNKGRFACPLCRKESDLNKGGVSNLPNNYTIMSLMDMVEGPSEGDTPQRTSPNHHLNTEVTSNTDTDTVRASVTAANSHTKCCRCRHSRGVFTIKCQHKICEVCKRREKMEVASIPCQLCLNVQHGIDYYTEDHMPPFCEHGTDLRPPAMNPGYMDAARGYTYGADTDFVLTTAVDGYTDNHDVRHVGYLDDTGHGIHGAHSAVGYHHGNDQDVRCSECDLHQNAAGFAAKDSGIGYGYAQNGVTMGYSSGGIQSGYVSNDQGQIAASYGVSTTYSQPAHSQTTSLTVNNNMPGYAQPASLTNYTQNSSHAVTGNLHQDFISRLKIEGNHGDGASDGYQVHPGAVPYNQGYISQTHVHTSQVPSTQANNALYQSPVQPQNQPTHAAAYQTQNQPTHATAYQTQNQPTHATAYQSQPMLSQASTAHMPGPEVLPGIPLPNDDTPTTQHQAPIPYEEIDPLQDSSQARGHSPPPAYSEIDQHPQVSSAQRSPNQRRKATKGKQSGRSEQAPKTSSRTEATPKQTNRNESTPRTVGRSEQPPKTAAKKTAAKSGTDSTRNKTKATKSPDHRESPPPVQPIRTAPPQPAQPIRTAPHQPVRGGVAVFPVAMQQQKLQKSGAMDGSISRSSGDTVTSPENVRTTVPSADHSKPKVPARQAPQAPSPAEPKVQSSPVHLEVTSGDGQVPMPKSGGPKAPPRRLAGEPQGLPFKCIRKFGRYSEAKMQSGAFHKPKRVSMSNIGQYIVVTDTQEMTVQTFTADGGYVYKFKVLGVEGACLWAQDKIAVATHRGIEVFTKNGHQEVDTPIGPCINAIPYKHGFIAVRQKSLVFFNNMAKQTSELTKKRIKSSPFKKYGVFEQIKDATVSMSKDIGVLENSGDVYIMDDEGQVKFIIQPQNEPCGKILDPFSLTFDRWSNIFISDVSSRKVLRFSPNGKFSRCVLNFTLGETSTNVNSLKAYGVSASSDADHLLIAICGERCAEVRIYKLY